MKPWTRSNSMIRRVATQDPGKAATEIISLQLDLAEAEERSANAGHHWREEKKNRIKFERQVAQYRELLEQAADELDRWKPRVHPGDEHEISLVADMIRTTLKERFKECGEDKQVAHGTACCNRAFGHKGPHKADGGWEWENDKSCK